MDENIQFAYVTRDGTIHHVNIAGVCTILDAAYEIASSALNGELEVDPKDIFQIIDIRG